MPNGRVRDRRAWLARQGGFRTVKSILPDVVNRIDEMYHSDGKLTGISTASPSSTK